MTNMMYKLFQGGALLVLLGCGSAHASIIYSLVSVTGGPSPALFDWKYNATLSGDQKIGPTANLGGGNSAPTTDFGLIIDFLGAQSASTSGLVGGLTASTSIENVSTQATGFAFPDLTTVPNVKTSLTGSYTPPAGGIVLYVLDVMSTSGTRGSFDEQEAQALKNAPTTATDGFISSNQTTVEAPAAPVTGTTPEPATMLTFGMGLIGLGLLRKRAKG